MKIENPMETLLILEPKEISALDDTFDALNEILTLMYNNKFDTIETDGGTNGFKESYDITDLETTLDFLAKIRDISRIYG